MTPTEQPLEKTARLPWADYHWLFYLACHPWIIFYD